jgi:hypothetical protein
MATKTALGNPEDNNKKNGIRKVNLSDLAGSLSKRGREAFHDDNLKVALIELMNGEGNENAFIWDDAFVVPTLSDKAKTTLQAKFRSRANSLVKQIATDNGNEFAITVQYTNAGEMVISKRNA